MLKLWLILLYFFSALLWRGSGAQYYSQSATVDSLKKLLANDRDDSVKVFHLNYLSRHYRNSGTYDSSIACSIYAAQLANEVISNNDREQKNSKIKHVALKSLVVAYSNIGNIYHLQADYSAAMIYYKKALEIDEELQNKSGIAKWTGNIGSAFYQQGDYANAMKYYLRALSLDRELKNDEGVSRHEGNIGIIYFLKGEYSMALNYYEKALKYAEKVKNMREVAKWLDAIGGVYYQQGNFPGALDCYLKALKTAEELNDKEAISRYLGSVGIFYYHEGNHAKALNYILKAMKINEELENKNQTSGHLGILGLIYKESGDYKKAQDYYLRALKIDEEIGNKNGIAKHFSNIGNIFMEKAKLAQNSNNNGLDSLCNKALEYFFKVIQLSEELENRSFLTINLGNIGSMYLILKKYKEAETYFIKSLAIAREIGSMEDIGEGHKNLAELYRVTGNDKKSLEQLKLYTSVKDSLFTEEKNKELTRHEMNYEFEKKEAVTKAEQEKKDAVTKAEKKKQQTVLLLVSCVLTLVFIFAGFIFRSLRITRKQKVLIEIKNKETEEQKREIEQKNEDILDSIRYAKRIQNSLLPTEKYIGRHLRG